jgi:hypothetical protein
MLGGTALATDHTVPLKVHDGMQLRDTLRQQHPGARVTLTVVRIEQVHGTVAANGETVGPGGEPLAQFWRNGITVGESRPDGHGWVKAVDVHHAE